MVVILLFRLLLFPDGHPKTYLKHCFHFVMIYSRISVRDREREMFLF